MKKFALTILFILLFFPLICPAGSIDIHRAIEYGLKNSYSMIIQNYELEQSKYSLYSSYLDILPRVSYYLSRSDSIISRSGYVNISESISSDDYRYFSIKNNLSSLEQKKINNKFNRKQFIFDIISKYTDILKQEKYLDIARQEIQQAEMDLSQTKILFSRGRASKLDLEQIKISLSQAKLDSLKAFNNFENSKINFCFFINFPYNENLRFEDFTYEFQDADDFEFLEENNLSIAKMKESVKQSKLNYFQNKLKFIPTFSFSINKNFSWEAKNIFDFDNSNPYSYTLSLSYPLLNPLKNFPANKSSKLNLQISKLSLKNIKQEEHKNFKYYRNLFNQTVENLKMLKLQEKLTKHLFELTNEKYKLGKADLTDLENARKNLFSDKYQTVSEFYNLILLQENLNLITNEKLLNRY